MSIIIIVKNRLHVWTGVNSTCQINKTELPRQLLIISWHQVATPGTGVWILWMDTWNIFPCIRYFCGWLPSLVWILRWWRWSLSNGRRAADQATALPLSWAHRPQPRTHPPAPSTQHFITYDNRYYKGKGINILNLSHWSKTSTSKYIIYYLRFTFLNSCELCITSRCVRVAAH